MTLGDKHRARSLTVYPIRQQRCWHLEILGRGLTALWDGKVVSGFDGQRIYEPKVDGGKLQSCRVIGISAGRARGSHGHGLDAFKQVSLRQALRSVDIIVLVVHGLHFRIEWIRNVEGDAIPLLAHNVHGALYEQRQWSGGIVQESDVSRAGVGSSSGPLAVIFDRL